MPFLGQIPFDLYGQAQCFVSRSWSIIPLRGDADPRHPKAPAVSRWRAYQSNPPSQVEVRHWFGHAESVDWSRPGAGFKNCAIGIVLGKVSGLAVLDIDDPDRASDFLREFPHLARTFTVVSGNRRLPHYYFRIPQSLSVAGRSCNGVELRSDGQYVVAPGSVIGGRSWVVGSDVEPLTLSGSDLKAILEFIQPKTPDLTKKRRKVPSRAKLIQDSVALSPSGFGGVTAPADMVARYHQQAVRLGRNNALFATARLARDSGVPYDQAQRMLVMAHVEQAAQCEHVRETPAQRMQEAMATIRSVYSRVPTPQRSGKQQLPNSVREALLACGQVNTARLLDALLMLDTKAGTTIIPAQVYDSVASFGIGRNVVYTVLKTLARPVVLVDAPPHTPPSISANAANSNYPLNTLCRVVRVANPGKKRGRPACRYLMPSVESLCEQYGVVDSGSDWLSFDDLKSPAAYRSALHAALVRRSPGQYSRDWLAQRLGVSRDSCRRYEKDRRVYSQPMYSSIQITSETVEGVLPEHPEPGQFLEDDRGKRYPPLPSLAKMLLAYGRRVVFRVQQVNHYSILRPLKAHSSPGSGPRSVIDREKSSGMRAPWRGVKRKRLKGGKQGKVGYEPHAADTVLVPIVAKSQGKALKPRGNCCGPQQLAFDAVPASCAEVAEDSALVENVAAQVYDRLRSLNPSRSVARGYARVLVKTYGSTLMVRGLELLMNRPHVQNPAGYLLAYLRSESGKSAPRPASARPPGAKKSKSDYSRRETIGDVEAVINGGLNALETQHRQWLDKLRNSVYADVYATALDPE